VIAPSVTRKRVRRSGSALFSHICALLVVYKLV
jgi:hypothetical protein